MVNWEVRQEVGRLRVEEKRSVCELAQEYKVSPSSITRWAKSYKEHQMSQVELDLKNIKTYTEKIKEMEDKINELEQENKALRKTLTILMNEKI